MHAATACGQRSTTGPALPSLLRRLILPDLARRTTLPASTEGNALARHPPIEEGVSMKPKNSPAALPSATFEKAEAGTAAPLALQPISLPLADSSPAWAQRIAWWT